MRPDRKCYMCEEEATTDEHVPPFGFFPKGRRINLFTVPSCPDHNTKNSKDVEYIRNIIVSHIGTNSIAREYFKDTVARSFDRSPKLKSQTFAKRKPILVLGEKTVVYQIEMERFNLVFKAIAHALFFKNFRETYNGSWIITSPSMIAAKVAFENAPDPYNPKVQEIASKIPFVEKEVGNPEVFRYSEYIDNMGGLIYKFEFYEGFVVYAVMPTKTKI